MPSRHYHSPARAKAAEQTRARIVAAAAKLLRSGGAGGFTLDAVGKAAGVTRLTVYNQFGSRRALLEAVFDDRAARGGLHRLREAMSDADPRSGLGWLIEIFCDFWSFDRGAMAYLHRVGANDAEFEEGLRSRNERRRQALSVLVGRLVARGEVRAEAANDLVDLLFVFTSFQLFAELTAGERTKDAACLLVRAAAEDAVRRAGR